MSSSSRKYVYRSIRDGGKVRRTYLGTQGDPVVQTLQEFQRHGRATADAEQQKVTRDLKLITSVDNCLRLISTTANRVVRNIRKRLRRSGSTRIRRGTLNTMRTTRDEYEALVSDAADGDETALASLRRLLAANSELCATLGNLNHHVQRHLIDLAADNAIDVKTALSIMLTTKRAELLRAGASLPEQMLVDQVLSTMLDAAVCQLGRSQPHAKESTIGRWDRRLTIAQTRHQAAIRALTEVRKMLEHD